MKTLRRLCVASMLTFTLSFSIFAGQMSTTVVQPPPPANAEAAGGMSTTASDNAPENGEASVLDSVSEAALSLLQNVLSLL
jgi:hypothetical protein